MKRTSSVGCLTSSPWTTSVFSGGGTTPSSLYSGSLSPSASTTSSLATSLPFSTGAPVCVTDVASAATGASDSTGVGASCDEPLRRLLLISWASRNAFLKRLASRSRGGKGAFGQFLPGEGLTE